MREIGVGLLGFGTVGAGVVQGLQENGDLIAHRLGLRLVLRKIADLDIKSDRGVTVDPALLTTDAEAVITDPSVDVVVELIGGVTVAKTLILKALELGKPVVTANKALLAEHGEEVFSAAERTNTDLLYEASVAGGIPIIRSLREGLIANHIESMYGILNGTCNYILTRMEQTGLSFDEALAQATEAGYAEADPTLDIDGHDTAHKAVILAALAYGFPVSLRDIHVEGIRNLDPQEISYARELGYRIKLLAIIKHEEEEVEVRVHPTLIPIGHTLAAVGDAYNAVLVKGDVTGDTLYYGKGAGRAPTASAVISDLADVARNLASKSERRVPAFVAHGHYGKLRPMGRSVLRYYIRLMLEDRPGVLGRVAEALGRHGVSIASMIQKERGVGGSVAAVVVTHEATESNLAAAVDEINSLAVVDSPAISLRIESFS
jgi:homoserine dehydrogenase